MSTEQERETRPPRKMQPYFRAGTAKKDSYSSASAAPVAAFVLAATSTFCIIGSAVVIHLSHNRIVGAWIPSSPSIQPSVLLSIFASIFRTGKTLSLSYGVEILWWRTVLTKTTLKNLHYIWNKGEWTSVDGLRRAWASSPQTKWLMVAFCFISITNFAEGPLLQRSTKPVLSLLSTEYKETWSLPQDIPDGWPGSVDGTAPAALFATVGLQQVLQDWHKGTDIQLPAAKLCNGTCTGEAVGPGITVNCSTAVQYLDLTNLESATTTAFDLRFNRTLDSESLPVLNMRLQFISRVDSQCNATIVVRSCTIRTAQVAYSVTFEDGLVSVATSNAPRVVENTTSVGDLVDTRDGLPAGSLAALDFLAHYYLQSNGTLGHNETENLYWFEPGYGTLSKEYADYDPFHFDNQAQCAFQWVDASENILANLHEVMFRMALAISDRSETLFPKTWRKISQTQFYRSDFRVFWVVCSFMTVSLLSSLSLLWGYWDLTRKVTLSPLETGRALCRGPLSTLGMEDMEVESLIEALGDTPMEWPPQTGESN